MRVRLTKSFDFDCAHHLPCFAEGHKCRNLHGHTMKVELVLEGDVAPERGYLVDFGEIKKVLAPVREQLDHKLLNDLEGLDVPTVENISRWIYDRLKPALPELTLVRVYETADNACEYWGA
jgi:6-pyruvoyltetrahydropterin/6-carboxytetrahydropterin synthase